jgi:hypothetical protein
MQILAGARRSCDLFEKCFHQIACPQRKRLANSTKDWQVTGNSQIGTVSESQMPRLD